MEFYTGHDGKEVTLKRFTVELDSSTSGSTTKSFAKDNVDYNESAINKMTSKEVTPVIASTSNQSRAVTKKLRKYDCDVILIRSYLLFNAFDSSSTSSLASTNLKIDIVAEPEEILALYASPNQIAKGEIVTLYDLCPLWLGLLVLVDTTVPLPKLSTLTFVEGKQNNENNSSCSKNSLTDTSESVPSWIKAELAEDNNSWRPDIYDVPSSLLNS
ncbi:uncharacterized protein LOC142332565 isoform X2 [Lycorma delicatula]|uniref:uncharacterized protein LOC142332565 isoform X2 n=1 Tax=Lycorma delicatula TaxID=130591 RepID=UPI003F5119C6